MTFGLLWVWLDGNVGMALFAAVFMLVCYGSREHLRKVLEERDSVVGWVVWSMWVLAASRLVAGITEAKLVDYCKPGIFHSEERCALHEAKQAVLEKYAKDEDAPEW